MERLPKGPYDESLYYKARKCAICLEVFKNEEMVIYLPCDPRHHFHYECIELWLGNSLMCPICKNKITFEAIENCRKYNELVDFVKQKDEESFISSRKTSAIDCS